MDDMISRHDAMYIKVSHGINENGIIYVPLGEVINHLKNLPSAQPSPCEFCKHNDISDDVACLRCSAERRTDG